jgi:glycerophosphoryl diester phosphodiesterase
VAHRGLPSREPENTLASFALALSEGAQGIELDVHVTRDDVVVVHHDPQLADGREIAALALAQIRGGSGPRDIPTLHEVLALVAGSAELFVEVKGAGIELKVAEALRGYAGSAALHSFDHAAIRRLADANVPWKRGILTEDYVADVPALLERHGATDYWPHHPLVTAAMTEAVHSCGGRVIPWTVNATSRMRELAALGVDGICTDDVRVLKQAQDAP